MVKQDVQLYLHRMAQIDFIEELKWRGLFFDNIPGTQEYLQGGSRKGYIGFDPTAPSLGIGNLMQVIILTHFQRAGHQPIALMGGATGMVGDPSGKSAERNLQSEEQLQTNLEGQKAELERFLDFDSKTNPAILVNNLEWYKEMNMLTYLRDIGKHLTVNYMLAKDSVKSRMETGISYTEFSYQLLQAYDYYRLYKDHDCRVQMGGSDQWGNAVTGVELIRRMDGGEAYAVTTPLITKADGTKFGKSEKGNLFVSPELTSPYQFYQFWMNVTDEDAESFIKKYTFLSREEIEDLIAQHQQDPGFRVLQKKLAEEVTVMVHSREDHDMAVSASKILFGKGTKASLRALSEKDLMSVFEGVPQFTVSRSALESGIDLLEFLADTTQIFASRGDVRRAIKGNALSINSEKIQDDSIQIGTQDLLNNRIIWVQNGKKNNYLVLAD